MIIGVTGTSGSGKTTISNMLKEKLNCNILDADQIARRMSKKGNVYYEEIVKYFGKEILGEEEEINRKRLAELIYADDIKKEKLNDITNIYVVDEIKKETSELEKIGIVIIDVPRLVESGLKEICDIVIAILADEELKLKRICQRDNIELELAKERLRIQGTDRFYINNSDYVVDTTNNETVKEQIEAIVKQIVKEY